jgi:hypothetical protein
MFRSLAVSMAATALALSVGAGCNKDKKDENRGLPPAKDWNAPAPGTAQGGGAQQGNPHAGVPGAPQNDPHAGVPGAPPINPHAGVPGAPQGGTDVTNLGLPAPDPNRAIDPKRFLEGTLSVKPDLAAKAVPGATIFLSVKRAGSDGLPTGAPLAVEKMTVAKLPQPFKLTERNAMIKGTSFSGKVVVMAWIDQDQDAVSKQPGDVLGMVQATIPAKGLKLVLNQVRK